MRIIHPGAADGRWVPGSSRRRRALREQLEQQDRERASSVAIEKAKEPSVTEWDWWGSPGRILAAEPCEAHTHSDKHTEGALRIVQGCAYDPGNAAYRMHTAVNECTKHASAFIRFGHTNPFCDLRQIDGDTQMSHARGAVWTADVIHSHADYWMQYVTKPPKRWRANVDQLLVRHYHGTRWDGTNKRQYQDRQQWPILNMVEDDIAGATLVGARLTLCALRPSRMAWLPIAVPVKRYRALVPKERRPGPIRIAHSPTRADYKGTKDLLKAVETLRRKGLKLDLVMIEGRRHDDALAMKADADLTFDSFWLGIQGSGLEAASMGQMVIAGDESVKALYEASEVGMCPYTFAKDRVQLTEVLERAVVDPGWRAGEAKRVGQYVVAYHDYAAVAKRYEGIIAKAMNRPEIITERTKRGKRVAA